MLKLADIGKRMLFWGALTLMIWAGYELSIRVDAMAGPLLMYYNMAVGEGIGLTAALKYVNWQIFQTPGFLLGCVILGLVALRSGNRPHLSYGVLPLALLAGVYALGARAFFSVSLWQMLKLLPLLLIVTGSAINIALHRYIRARRRQSQGSNAPGIRRF